jgi:hypothetical protein
MRIKSKGTKLDFTATAASTVSRAIGQDLFTGEALPDPNEGKDPRAVARGKAGGLVGGKARAEKLTAKKRSQIAKKAAKSRWQK